MLYLSADNPLLAGHGLLEVMESVGLLRMLRAEAGWTVEATKDEMSGNFVISRSDAVYNEHS